MTTPRVVHVVPALFGHEGVYGGAERYALELARMMAERVPTRLVAFGSTPMNRPDGRLRIDVVRNLIPYRRFRFDPIGPMLAPHLAWANEIHYHQTHTFMSGVSLIIGKLTGRRVFTSHLGGSGFGLHRLTDLTGHYDGHLHISEFSRRTFGHADLKSARIIGGGVDPVLFHPPNSPPAREYVLFAGRLLAHKGIDYLVEGVPAEVPLIVAGRPWRHAMAFLERVRGLALGKNVRFEENSTDAELRTLYQSALCVVLPSVYQSADGGHHPISELLGQTLIEGMACGTPAICTAVGGMPEIVEDGVSGFVVPPNDPGALGEKIRWLRNHPVEADAMGRAARERICTHFTWNAVVDRCLLAYESVDPA